MSFVGSKVELCPHAFPDATGRSLLAKACAHKPLTCKRRFLKAPTLVRWLCFGRVSRLFFLEKCCLETYIDHRPPKNKLGMHVLLEISPIKLSR